MMRTAALRFTRRAAVSVTAVGSAVALTQSHAVAEAESGSASTSAWSLGDKLVAEALGTGMIVAGGCGSVCAMRYGGAAFGPLGVGGAFGTAVALAIYATADISGAHLNPAVTIALATQGAIDAGEATQYCLAQCMGAAIAGTANFAIYANGIKALEATEGLTRGAAGSCGSFGGAFGMIPTESLVSVPRALFVETGITGALAFMIFALTDADNTAVPKGAAPALIGLTVGTLVSQFGCVTGAGMNPARDLGPRLVTALAGWGGASLSKGWWIYTVGPVLGACAGAAMYKQVFTKKGKF